MSVKKKLLLLSSYGGYGHMAAANTLKTLLGSEYEIDVVYPIKELRLLYLKHSEGFYNFFLSRNFNRFTNWYVRWLGAPIVRMKKKKLERIIKTHIEEKGTDLVISLIPMVNYPACAAAHRMGVPFLMVTTDNDLTNWVFDLELAKAFDCRATIGPELLTSKGALLSKHIAEEKIFPIGLPLRPEFLHLPTKEEMRAKYEIPLDKNVVLVMMGGAGGRLLVRYVEALAELEDNLHLVVCTGRNKKAARRLRMIHLGKGNTMDVVPFTEQVHELFALADLLITKPGPGTINEAISCHLPLLIDQINPPVFWEKANIRYVQDAGIGDCIREVSDLPRLVHSFLFDEQLREGIARNYEMMATNQFAQKIEPLLKGMIDEMVNVPLVRDYTNV